MRHTKKQGVECRSHNNNESNSLVPLALEIARNRHCDMRTLRCFLENISLENETILAWLTEYKDSPNTQRIYHKEIERVFLWAIVEKKERLLSLSRLDFDDYVQFLENPPKDWCMAQKHARFDRTGEVNIEWRPFLGSLSQASIARALRIVNNYYDYLLDAGILKLNPLALMKNKNRKKSVGQSEFKNDQGLIVQRDKNTTDTTTYAFDLEEWEAIHQAVEAMSQKTNSQRNAYERTRLIISLFSNFGARITELTTHAMGCMEKEEGIWKWFVVGKGGKSTWLPLNDALLEAVKRYRLYLGKSELPEPGDDTPLCPSLNGSRPIKTRQVHNIVKQVLQSAADIVQDSAKNKRLLDSSAHWFRHTFITNLHNKNVSAVEIQRLARHSNYNTTLQYNRSNTVKLQEAVNKLNLKTNKQVPQEDNE